MAAQLAPTKTAKLLADERQRQIRARVASLSYLPTTAAVALKFVELGKNPDAEPEDYAKIISADSSLSSKLFALANSSWAGVRHRVTTVKMAVNLLGLGTVRTLAISYCMTGLHNELRLNPAESQLFWETSLCKAVAARRYAREFDAKLADEAFVAGLFQDFALAVIYSVVREPYMQLLAKPGVGVQALLLAERQQVGMDHSEVGRSLAQKLELPEVFVDTVAFHHHYDRLTEFVTAAPVRDGTFVAGMLPHILNTWNRDDATALAEFLQSHAPALDMPSYIGAVQSEFVELYRFFHEGAVPHAQLTTLLEQTAREAADNTTMLVGTVNELLREVATMGAQVRETVKQLEAQANSDALTGTLSRQAFSPRAEDLLAKAARYGFGLGVVYLDIDNFKRVNDELGHTFGDLALKSVANAAAVALPPDALLARLGGDEFVAVFGGCTEAEAKQSAEQIVGGVSAAPVSDGSNSRPISVSAGLLYVRPTTQKQDLNTLLRAADKVMYAAKEAGGNRVESRTV